MTAVAAIRTFIEGRLDRWNGLPAIRASELVDSLGQPVQREEVTLGAYPALRLTFAVPDRAATLHAYERGGQVVMVERSPPPDITAMESLPEPSAVMPQEVHIDQSYAHEVLYCERGLLLTIAEPLDGSGRKRLVRCRGIRPLPPTARTPGADLYIPLDARIKW